MSGGEAAASRSRRRQGVDLVAMAHHGHAHTHTHIPSHAAHDEPGGSTRRRLAIALGLILAFMAVEVAVGIAAHSLALLSDAGHMLTDAGAIGFALVAARLAQR